MTTSSPIACKWDERDICAAGQAGTASLPAMQVSYGISLPLKRDDIDTL